MIRLPPRSTLFPYNDALPILPSPVDRRSVDLTAFPDLVVIYVGMRVRTRSEEHTSELQSRVDLVCRLLLEKKKKQNKKTHAKKRASIIKYKLPTASTR